MRWSRKSPGRTWGHTPSGEQLPLDPWESDDDAFLVSWENLNAGGTGLWYGSEAVQVAEEGFVGDLDAQGYYDLARNQREDQ